MKSEGIFLTGHMSHNSKIDESIDVHTGISPEIGAGARLEFVGFKGMWMFEHQASLV